MGRDLEPLADRMVVRVVKDPEVTAGGVVLPEMARERSQRGVVLAVGPGVVGATGERVALDVEVGDVVLFSKYGGTELPEGLDTLLVLREADVLCKEREVDGPGMTGAEREPVRVGGEDPYARETDRVAEEAREGYSPVLTPENEALGRELEEQDRLREEAGGRARMDVGGRESVTPEGMTPMPQSNVQTQYQLIDYADAVTRGLLESGRVQEVRNGFRYDMGSYSYWREPDAAQEAGDR